MKKQGIAAALAAFGVFGFISTTAQAGTYVIDDTDSGYISVGGNFTGIRPNTNYLVGLCDANDCRRAGIAGEYRDFFYFTIPVLDAPIASATLVIPTGNTVLNQSPTLTYQVTSLGLTPGQLGPSEFSALGTGTVYGSNVYSAAEANTTQDISLDAAAISELGQGGFLFGLSGRAISAIDFTPTAPDQLVFGLTQRDVTQLVITTAPGPVPGTGLFALAFLSLAGVTTKARRWLNG